MHHDPRVDAIIAAAAPFAQPILRQVRATMHDAGLGLSETIKWGRPFFLIEGRPFAFMAAFKGHAALGFWRGMGTGREQEAAGQFGRLTRVEDLPPPEELLGLIRAAAADLADPPARPQRSPKPEIAMAEDFAAALAGDAAATAGWSKMPPGARREYLESIVGAKQAATRERRIAKALGLLAEGRKLNDRYMSQEFRSH